MYRTTKVNVLSKFIIPDDLEFDGAVMYETESVVLVTVDWCEHILEMFTYGSLGLDGDFVILDNNHPIAESQQLFELSFPEFKHLSIFSVNVEKKCMRIVFWKYPEDE